MSREDLADTSALTIVKLHYFRATGGPSHVIRLLEVETAIRRRAYRPVHGAVDEISDPLLE
jgi:hypothetical protein